MTSETRQNSRYSGVYVKQVLTDPTPPQPVDFSLSSFGSPARMDELTQLHIKLCQNTATIEEQIGYCQKLRLWACDACREEEGVTARGSGWWFPMPMQQETNGVWAEWVYRLYCCVCRLLSVAQTTDLRRTIDSRHENGVPLVIRRKRNLWIRQLMGLLEWWQAHNHQYWPDYNEGMDQLGLAQPYREVLRRCLRAYGLWNAGCMKAQQLDNEVWCDGDEPVELLEDTEEDLEEFKFMVEGPDEGLMVGSSNHEARASSVQDLSDERVHPLDRPVLQVLAEAHGDEIRTVANLFYTCYLQLTHVPAWVPLYGLTPLTCLSQSAEPILADTLSSAVWKKASAGEEKFSCRDPALQAVYEFQYTQKRWTQGVMHNAVPSNLVTSGVEEPLTSSILTRKRANHQRTWSEMAKTQFLLWCSRFYRLARHDNTAAMALLRCATLNGDLVRGYLRMENDLALSLPTETDSVTVSIKPLLKQVVQNLSQCMKHGLPPQGDGG